MKTFEDIKDEIEQDMAEESAKSEISVLMEQHKKYYGYLTHIHKFDASTPLSRMLERWVKHYKDKMDNITGFLEDELRDKAMVSMRIAKALEEEERKREKEERKRRREERAKEKNEELYKEGKLK